jgi:peptidoglycan/LPS O-acetylase OafA/YrhL
VNSALWSLHWEVLFSLLLPFFIFVVGLGRRSPWLLALGACALVAVSPQTDDSVYYLSIFLIGSTLAVAHSRIVAWIDRLNRRTGHSVVWSTLILAALLMLLTHWLIGRSLAAHGLSVYEVEAILRVFYGVGAALLIVAALGSSWFKRVLTQRFVHWLGSRSFSLYLVHEPIIVTSAFAFGRTPSMSWFLPLMIVISLCAAEIFFRLIEQPSLKLAQRVGQNMKSRPAQIATRTNTSGV